MGGFFTQIGNGHAMPCHAAMSGQLPPNNKCCITLVPCHSRESLMFRDTLKRHWLYQIMPYAIDCYIISILVGYYGKPYEFSMKPRVSTLQDPLDWVSAVYLTFTRSSLKEPRNSVGTWGRAALKASDLGLYEWAFLIICRYPKMQGLEWKIHKSRVGKQTINLLASIKIVILGWFKFMK